LDEREMEEQRKGGRGVLEKRLKRVEQNGDEL